MAMLNCPECDQLVSFSADACPHCGYPLSEILSHNERVAEAIVKRSATDENIHHLLALAEDESANPILLEQVARYGNLDTARRLARNQSTPPHVLERLSYLDDKELLVSIAKNPHTSPDTLARLFQRVKEAHTDPATGYYKQPQSGRLDESYDRLRALKVALALNHNTPEEVLSRLVEDFDYIVSAAVFGNSKLPERFFVDYMECDISFAGPCGLLNPLIPCRDLTRQFDSGPSKQSRQVAKNSRLYEFAPERFDSQSEYANRYIRAVQGAGFPRLPRESIEAIERVGVGFPEEIVLNPAATLDILLRAFDEERAIEVWTARDPKTPKVVIERLYREGYGMVRVAAAANPNLPESIFTERFGGRRRELQRHSDDDCGPSPDELDYSGWESHDDWAEYGASADVNYWDDAAMDELRPQIEADKAARAEIEDAIAVAEYERSEEDRYQAFLEDYAFATNPSTPAYALHVLAQRGGDIARVVASNPSAPEDLLGSLLNDDCWDAVIMNPSCSIALLESIDDEDEDEGEETQALETPSPVQAQIYDEEIPF